MDIIIHRRTHQIGGCVTEIKTDQGRIIIDFGSELPDKYGNIKPSKFKLDGINEGCPNCDAVLFTHYHDDHTGMINNILSDIPLYMGPAAKEIYLIYQNRIKGNIEVVKELVPLQWVKNLILKT